MEKIRKIGRQLWLAKERIVLAIMVAVFAWQVYKVQSPPEVVEEEPVPIPKSVLPDNLTELGIPMPPSGPPPLPPLTDYRSLVRTNMFWYFSGQPTASETTEVAPSLSLTNIMSWPDGSYRAEIQTASSRQWIGEGEDFEDYTLMSIDPDAQTVVVYDAKKNQEFVLGLQ